MKKRKISILSKFLFLVVFVFGSFINCAIAIKSNSFKSEVRQQQIEVTGTVTDVATGDPLPGVNIVVEGTNIGTTTNMDGEYTIEAPSDATLIVSFVGYQEQRLEIKGRQKINVELIPSVEEIDEVVVTALGLSREKKSLGYSVEEVSGEEMTRVAQENVLNSMAGKVTGVTINSTGGAGSSVSMVIRGATSLSTDNQPLFVVDGVPMFNTVNNVGGFGDRNLVDYGNAISDLNPEDIQDVSILKGPSAAALYGTRAGNGVVLITTKQAGDRDGLEVSVTSNTVFDIPHGFLDITKKFGPGYFPIRPEDIGGGVLPYSDSRGNTGSELDKGYWAPQWHSPLDANGERVPIELVSYPDNIKNFVNTGFTTTNGVSVSNSTELIDFRLGITNMIHGGLIPNSDLGKNTFVLSASSRAFENVTISTDINFSNTGADNRPSSNRGTNPLQWAYQTPNNIPIEELSDYWVPGAEGLEVVTISPAYSENPYFLAHEVNNSFDRNAIFGNMVADWEISPSFSIMGRYSLNRSDEVRETKISPGYSREPNNGTYGIANLGRLETNMKVLATYTRDWEDFYFSASGGGNILYSRSSNSSNSAKNGSGLIVPNVYTVQNISSASLNYSSALYERAVNSVYGLANFGWRDMVYLDLTARNDWSSTLPAENNSYFYPSASLSFLVNEAFDLGRNVNMLKLRGGWAQVGNDTSPYSLTSVYGDSGQWGDAIRLNKPGTLLTPDLKPEQATSKEIGVEARVFNNRLRFDGTYYQVENRNQILGNIPLAASSGFSNIKLNTGLLDSQGVELMLGVTPVRTNDWNWDLNINFTKNETIIRELAEGVEFIQFWGDNKMDARGYAYDPEAGHNGLVGNLYAPLKKKVTDENSPYYGYPIVSTATGNGWIPEEEPSLIGNYNPDFIMGLQSQLRFKNFTLSATFDWRSGGQYVSQTYRYYGNHAQTQTWLDNNLVHPGDRGLGKELRDWVVANDDWLVKTEEMLLVGGPTPDYGGFPEALSGITVYDGLFSPGVLGYHDDDGNFILVRENLGNEGTNIFPYILSNPWDFGTQNVFDADYIKLREVSLGFQLPQSIANSLRVKSASISVYSRNIMLWTKDSDFGTDPERAYQAESSTGNRGMQFKQGIERYNVDPRVIPIGFRLDLNF